MWIDIDTSVVPPTCELVDADDFTALEVRLRPASHAFVDPTTLASLAGGDDRDPDWHRQFQAMLDFAAGHGWVRDDGAVRMHVKLVEPTPGETRAS